MAWLPNTCNGDATIVSLTESYAPGIYLVKLNVEGNHVVKKLIIE